MSNTLANFFGTLELQGELENILTPGPSRIFKNSCRVYLDERPKSWGVDEVFERAWSEIEKRHFGEIFTVCFITTTDLPKNLKFKKSILAQFHVDITEKSIALEMPIEDGNTRQLTVAYHIDRMTLRELVYGVLRRSMGGEPYLPYDMRFFSEDLTIMCDLYDDRGMDFVTFDYGNPPAPLY